MSTKFNKILLIKKTTKFERMKQSGKSFSPYIENVLMKVWYVYNFFELYSFIKEKGKKQRIFTSL